jgi:CelD/BcsL family acetyltransferase involved in cellulose biosynthesis
MISRSIEPALTLPIENERATPITKSSPITVERACTDAALAEMKERWESLHAEAASPNPFLTWGWSSSWWRHFGKGKQLEILSVRENGELIGIAPFYRETVRMIGIPFRRLGFLGDEGIGSDHLDLICRKGLEETVANAVARSWREGSPQYDFIHFRSFSDRSLSLPSFAEALGRKWVIQPEEGEVCPYLPLDSTWEAYLNKLSGSMRYTIRRKMRNLEKEGSVDLVVLEDAAAGRDGLEKLIDLHQKRWNAQGGSDAFLSEAKIPFHRETADYLFEKGIAKLFFLNVNRQAVASLYGFLIGGKFFYYQAGFDPSWGDRSVGMVLMGKSIQSAIDRGWGEFDFLRGPEAYKAHWTSSQRKTWNIFIYPPRFTSALYRNLLGIKNKVKIQVKKSLSNEWIKKLQALRGVKA